MEFKTSKINIETIVEKNMEFLIPVYQRPYVWDDTEIKKLLEDLQHNFEINTEKEYYVGNTYVIKSSKDEKRDLYEVIDGQQRFTTFWLLSLCFKDLCIETDLTNYLEINFENHKDIRFDFDIRKEVYEYLKGLLDGSSERRFQNTNDFEFLKNIAAGIETIKGFLYSALDKESLTGFGNYIFRNVNFIFNEAPENTDLNALFIALGTSGIQLQQSDIMKARLLDKLEKGKRVTYSKIWEACENMSNYFESNVKLSMPFDTSKIEETDFSKFNAEKFNSNGYSHNIYSGKAISEIIDLEEDILINEETLGKQNTECRSIVSFNVFLFHVLRIYRKEKNIEFDIDSMDPKNLLQTFNIDIFNESDDIIEFIELMWNLRYIFDKHVVKWLKDEDQSFDEDEKLLLTIVNTSKNYDKSYFSRIEKGFSNVQMLQSVLYFTGVFKQQYWLTPFLYFLYNNENCQEIEIQKELERIDNIMIPGDKKNISWQIINNTNSSVDFDKEIKSTLQQASGTHFNHYWFYKLEYLLWKKWEVYDDKYKRYRITSKNSIEHVFPQNQEYKHTLNDLNDGFDWLNSIGNLALLSVGQNSSYSNQDVGKKRIDFNTKITYDSLKLAEIYDNNLNWNTEEIKKHTQDIFLIFEEHYSNN